MKKTDIIIRDPYILLVGDTYYMYGSNSLTCWEPGETSFYCYKVPLRSFANRRAFSPTVITGRRNASHIKAATI